MKMETEWVLLVSSQTPVEAEIKKGFLESSGVSVMLEGLESNTILTHMQIGLGGVRINVQKKDLMKAQKLLESLPNENDTAGFQSENKVINKDLKTKKK